jgi:hypothetical protein
MSINSGGVSQASDFNNFLTGNFGSFWGTGSGNAGWGQTLPSTVTSGSEITSTGYWTTLVSDIITGASHTGTSIPSYTVPSSGLAVQNLNTLSTSATSVYNNRLNATVQGSTSSTTSTNTTGTWDNYLQFTFSVQFGSANQARYFFNAGGQIGLNFSHNTLTNPIDNTIQNICNALGTLWLSSPTSGIITLAGASYNGVTKVGGTSGYDTTNINNGFYNLTSTNVTLVYQRSPIVVNSYSTSTNLTVQANYVGSTITFTCTFNEVPTGAYVATGTTGTCTIRPPSTTYLINTWGTPTVTASNIINSVYTRVYSVTGDFNPAVNSYDVNNGSAILYGAHTTSGGSAGMPGLTWVQNYDTHANLYQINCSNNWFPLLITLQNNYRLGSGDVSPAYNDSTVPMFMWRYANSNWTDSMITNEFGLNASQVANVKTGAQVWWEGAFGSEDDTLYYGLAVVSAANYNPSIPGNAWNNATITPYFLNQDSGAEWSSHGFQYFVTTDGANVTGQTDYTYFAKTGSTSRDSGGVIGSLSDYTIKLDANSLVIPVVKSDNGFSGGARNSTRNPLVVRFGYIGLNSYTNPSPASGTVIFDTRVPPLIPTPNQVASFSNNWCTFLQNHGVWTNNTNTTFDAIYKVNFPIYGTYTIEMSTDNNGYVSIDSLQVLSCYSYTSSVKTTVTLSAGTHYISVHGVYQNVGGAAGIGVLITFGVN